MQSFQNQNRDICQFFAKGNCKYGNNCKKLHQQLNVAPQNFQNPKADNQNMKKGFGQNQGAPFQNQRQQRPRGGGLSEVEERKMGETIFNVVSEDIGFAQNLSSKGKMIQTVSQLDDGKISLVFGMCSMTKANKVQFTKTESFTVMVELYPDRTINPLLGIREALVPGLNPEIEVLMKYKEKWIGNKRYVFLIARRLDMFNSFSHIVVYARIENDQTWTKFHCPIGEVTEIFDIGYTNQIILLTCTDMKMRKLILAISPDGRPAIEFSNPANIKSFGVMEKFAESTFALVGRSETALHICPFVSNAFSSYDIAMPKEVIQWEIINPNILLTISQTGEWYYYQPKLGASGTLEPTLLGSNKLTIPAHVKEPFYQVKMDMVYCQELQFPIIAIVNNLGFLTMFAEANAPFVNNVRVSSNIQKGVVVTFLKLFIVRNCPSGAGNGLFIHVGTSQNLLIVLKIDLNKLF